MSKFTILLLDDVEANIYSLKLMIEDNFDDINILTSLNAQDAMALLMENSVDLILSDIQMPEVDGFQFAEYIKGIEKTKDIPIIFITGIYDKSEYQKKGYDLGAVEYISKPIDDVLLSSKLKVYIDLFDSLKTNEKELSKKNEMLIHQSKMATIGEMIGVIVHQLKQPLNIMSLYCDDVKDSYKYDEIDEKFIDKFHQKTKEQIAFMSTTIDDFSDFFNPKKIKKTFLLKDSIEKILKILEKHLESNNINIDINVSNEQVFGVDSELEQVILNIVTNSKDAFNDRKIEERNIKINSLEKGKYTILMIEDNAGGIKEEDIERIFDPYYTTKDYGTGIGLYMVKLVVQSSFAGDLKLQNTKEGIKFIIALSNKSLID
ncbi:sensor histidine kinase [Arcobacter sp. LA11]|uniref:sensor histidine kinase n=1 Tax=Arcobacter sp. LA11 TaxID=1898176 RepID=UPI000934E9B0|nr:hybrid sensor histidine kinase/response regulator [Arcobacter sp. LA11]